MFNNYAKRPTVFVSSTCYDLKQIRVDIRKTLEDEMGLEALLSEFESFPLDPALGTVDNCLRVVKERADILILIIGGKYGYITENGKSVTNLEYLQAKEKGIPIYTFVDKRIISTLPIWRDNPDGNYSSMVDTNELFTFVDELMNKENVWVYGYETAQEICSQIKYQFSYLFQDSLMIRNKFTESRLPPRVLNQSAAAVKLALEQTEPLWEYQFFFQVLRDKFEQLSDRRRDLEYKIFIDPTDSLDEPLDIFTWITNKNTKLMQIVDSLGVLINKTLPHALAEDGQDSDLDFLVYVATRISEIYQKALDWEIDLHSKVVPEDAEAMVRSLAVSSQVVIQEFDRILLNSKVKLANLPKVVPEGETYEIDLSMTFGNPDFTDFQIELQNYQTQILLELMSE
ncbi:DUF4062 domain-containing protein [Enterococcus sp. AZ072]|uniref:DUF4062 domain-containing protein n=1 Tax=unclassified Enterococcus TaxID=2608891 RepID=UPI003D2E9A46